MKTIFVICFAGMFLASGVLNVLKQIKITNALEEIVRFINFVKTEVHYTNADFDSIFLRGKARNYKYITFSENQIFLDKSVSGRLNEEFDGFIRTIGTTDEEGQLNICREYKERFEQALSKRRIKETEKIQVNTALSLLGALTVLIFFL